MCDSVENTLLQHFNKHVRPHFSPITLSRFCVRVRASGRLCFSFMWRCFCCCKGLLRCIKNVYSPRPNVICVGPPRPGRARFVCVERQLNLKTHGFCAFAQRRIHFSRESTKNKLWPDAWESSSLFLLFSRAFAPSSRSSHERLYNGRKIIILAAHTDIGPQKGERDFCVWSASETRLWRSQN